jgi:hypothetical protein
MQLKGRRWSADHSASEPRSGGQPFRQAHRQAQGGERSRTTQGPGRVEGRRLSKKYPGHFPDSFRFRRFGAAV